jgi:hypothetical protein
MAAKFVWQQIGIRMWTTARVYDIVFSIEQSIQLNKNEYMSGEFEKNGAIYFITVKSEEG